MFESLIYIIYNYIQETIHYLKELTYQVTPSYHILYINGITVDVNP